MLKGEYGVGRVIARPFLGRTADTFYRTTNRHDLSLKPPRKTMLDLLKDAGRDVIAVGKIFRHLRRRGRDGEDQDHRQHQRHRLHQGFADPRLRGSGLREPRRFPICSTATAATWQATPPPPPSSTSSLPTHPRDAGGRHPDGHGRPRLRPSYTKTTDHTREYVPYLICGKGVKPGVDLGTRLCFGTIAQTICDYLGVDASTLDGQSVLSDILK